MSLAAHSNEKRIDDALREFGCGLVHFTAIAGVIGRTRLTEALKGGRPLDQTDADRLLTIRDEMAELRRTSLTAPDWTDAEKIRRALESTREGKQLLVDEGFELEQLGYER